MSNTKENLSTKKNHELSAQKSSTKSIQSQKADEDDDIFLEIEPPKPKGSASLAQTSLPRDYEVLLNGSSTHLHVYMTINRVYFQNLLDRREKPNISEGVRRTVGQHCIIFKEFIFKESQSKEFMLMRLKKQQRQQLQRQGKSDTEVQVQENGIQSLEQRGLQNLPTVKGNIQFIYTHLSAIELKVYVGSNILTSADSLSAQFHYSYLGIWKYKYFHLEPTKDKSGREVFVVKVPYDDMKQYMNPNIILSIDIRRQEVLEKLYLGIQNAGNTCYMNSCLQMLYHLRPLRKIVLDKAASKSPLKGSHKLLSSLRDAFLQMMDTEEQKAVDIQHLIVTYGKFAEQPRRQQDVQQFLLDFISELELECPELKIFWEGKTSYITQSQEPEKPYRSSQQEDFCQLDIHMADSKGSPYKSIVEALEDLKRLEEVDDKIDHDEYGKIAVSKARTFQILPDVLFVNLKRYEFDKKKMRMSKILSPLEYPEKLNLDFLLDEDKDQTPGAETDSKSKGRKSARTPNGSSLKKGLVNEEADYTLYSVIVHKGFEPYSGHYFSFVNTATDPSNPNWYEFNDSRVRKAETERVMNFTGKKSREVVLDKDSGQYLQKQFDSSESSYLLVYLRKAVFHEYQSLPIQMPLEYLNRKMILKDVEDKKNMLDVKILIFQNEPAKKISDRVQGCDIFAATEFEEEVDIIKVPLNQEERTYPQLQKIENTYLGCKILEVFKVNRAAKCIKPINRRQQTPSHTFLYRKGASVYDYLLIVPQNSSYVQKVNKNPPRFGYREMALLQIKDETTQVSQLRENNEQLKLIFSDQIDKWESKYEKEGKTIVYEGDEAVDEVKLKWNYFQKAKIVSKK